jgi:alpha-tubulin suppressor-like RCC1 family protein
MSFGVSAIAADFSHTCALKAGALYCWGDNSYGQVGDGTTTSPRASPVSVSNMNLLITAVTVGNYHTCSLKLGGTMYCWGSNQYGQIGDGTTTGKSSATVVSGLGLLVATISAGGDHSCTLAIVGACIAGVAMITAKSEMVQQCLLD